MESADGEHGLDLAASRSRRPTSDPLTIDRHSLMGFAEDFANERGQGNRARLPSRSLLFHALASANVLQQLNGVPLDLFPTPSELDAVENYIFGVRKLKLADVIAKFPGKPLQSLCSPANTGRHPRRPTVNMPIWSIRGQEARVGNRPARYVPQFRGFHPEVPAEPFGIAVSPARYSAYLAVQLSGNAPEVHRMGSTAEMQIENSGFPFTSCFPVRIALMNST